MRSVYGNTAIGRAEKVGINAIDLTDAELSSAFNEVEE